MAEKHEGTWWSCAAVLSVAVLLRIYNSSDLFYENGSGSSSMVRPLLLTPWTEYAGVRDCAVVANGYESQTCPHSPLLVWLFSMLPNRPATLAALFDSMSSVLIAFYARDVFSAVPQTVRSWPAPLDDRWLAVIVALCFLWNPVALSTAKAGSIAPFQTMLLLAAVVLAVRRHTVLSAITVALAVHAAPMLLFITPAIMLAASTRHDSVSWKRMAAFCITFVSWSGSLLLTAGVFNGGNFSFVEAMLRPFLLGDFTPNLGISWYMFSLMFEQYRVFFTGTYLIIVASVILPMCWRLSHAPSFLLPVVVALLALFRPDPTAGDVSLSIIMMLPWTLRLQPYLQYTYLCMAVGAIGMTLANSSLHAWLVTGAGNPNFFFGATTVLFLTRLVLLSDHTHAFLRREYQLHSNEQINTSATELIYRPTSRSFRPKSEET